MAVYAVGDIQGCYKPLKALLEQVDFNPKKDVLWCCGDMVNRGPDSLKVLRFLKKLGDACICVLGNHDLQLLAYAEGGKAFPGDTLDEVLAAKDADALIHWLRHQPLLHHDKKLNWCMVHAGLSPLWSRKKAKKRARKIEKIIQSEQWHTFSRLLQEKEFPTQEPEEETERNLFVTSVFTRTRFCSETGVFDWQQKTADVQEENVRAWFEHPQAKWKKKCRVVFGHWAARGLVENQEHVFGLDTGCVWGGSLTMLRLDDDKRQLYTVSSEVCLGID